MAWPCCGSRACAIAAVGALVAAAITVVPARRAGRFSPAASLRVE